MDSPDRNVWRGLLNCSQAVIIAIRNLQHCKTLSRLVLKRTCYCFRLERVDKQFNPESHSSIYLFFSLASQKGEVGFEEQRGTQRWQAYMVFPSHHSLSAATGNTSKQGCCSQRQWLLRFEVLFSSTEDYAQKQTRMKGEVSESGGVQKHQKHYFLLETPQPDLHFSTSEPLLLGLLLPLTASLFHLSHLHPYAGMISFCLCI